MIRSFPFWILLTGVVAGAKLKSPSNYFNLCSRKLNQEMFSECVLKSIEKSLPLLIKGIPEIGLLPLDPLTIDKMEMKENNGRFKLDQTLYDLKIYGLSNFKLLDFSMDLDSLTLNATIFNPFLQMEGEYKMDGQVLIPIKGSGHSSYNFTEVTSTDNITFKKVQKNNKTYLQVTSFKLHIEPKGARSHFSNLFNGDKRLGEATNNFFNENWYEVFDTYRALPERAFSEFLKSQIQQVYSRYTFDELFPA